MLFVRHGESRSSTNCAPSRPSRLREVNILEDSAAYAKFQEEIPVVFIDGRKAFKYHLDEKAFLRRLKSRSVQGE